MNTYILHYQLADDDRELEGEFDSIDEARAFVESNIDMIVWSTLTDFNGEELTC